MSTDKANANNEPGPLLGLGLGEGLGAGAEAHDYMSRWIDMPHLQMDAHMRFILDLHEEANITTCDHAPVLIYSTDRAHELAVRPRCRRCGKRIVWNAASGAYAVVAPN